MKLLPNNAAEGRPEQTKLNSPPTLHRETERINRNGNRIGTGVVNCSLKAGALFKGRCSGTFSWDSNYQQPNHGLEKLERKICFLGWMVGFLFPSRQKGWLRTFASCRYVRSGVCNYLFCLVISSFRQQIMHQCVVSIACRCLKKSNRC